MQGAISLYFYMLYCEHKKCPTLCGRASNLYRYIFLNTKQKLSISLVYDCEYIQDISFVKPNYPV